LLIADVLQIYDNLHDTDDSFVGYNGLVTVGSCLCVDGFLLCVVALMIFLCKQDASILAAMWWFHQDIIVLLFSRHYLND